jgi:hypothetical protein
VLPPVIATGALVAANTCTPKVRSLCTCVACSTQLRAQSAHRLEGHLASMLLRDLALAAAARGYCTGGAYSLDALVRGVLKPIDADSAIPGPALVRASGALKRRPWWATPAYP